MYKEYFKFFLLNNNVTSMLFYTANQMWYEIKPAYETESVSSVKLIREQGYNARKVISEVYASFVLQ